MKRKSIQPHVGLLFLILCLALGLAGCASTSGTSYTRSQARQVQTEHSGVIRSIQEVRIEQDSTLLGPALGGVAGGVLGNTIGGGRGRILTTVGGAALGAVLGAAGEKLIRNETAYEFSIDLDEGGSISVVQAPDQNVFSVGDRVRVLRGADNSARVVHAR